MLPYKVTFFTFYFIFIFYHNPFTPKPHCADPCPLYCLQAKGHQFKIHGQPFYHCWWSSAYPPLCHSVQFTSSLSSHLLKPHCCFYRGPHKPVFISQSMPWLCAEVSNRYLFFTGHCWFFLHLWYDDSPRDCLETTNRSFSRGRGE